MEFDFEKHRVIGRIEYALGQDKSSARIKVLGIVDDNGSIIYLNDNQSSNIFQHNGFIFAPGLLKNTKYEISGIYEFNIQKNLRAIDLEDIYIIDRQSITIKGFKAVLIDGFKFNYDYVDISKLTIKDKSITGLFYGIANNYIIGKFQVRNGNLETEENKLKVWDKSDCKCIVHNNNYHLLSEPEGEYFLLDCLDDNLLFDWFRGQIKEIDPPLFQKLNTSTNWKTKIPSLFDKLPLENAEIEKIRLKRIERKISHIEFTWNEIIEFREQSPSLKKVFNDAIKTHIEDFKSEYSKELKEFEDEIIRQKREKTIDFEKLEQEAKTKIAALNTEINKKQTEAQKAFAEYEQAKLRLIEIEKEKSRIISDFGIIKEVLSLSGATMNSISESSYILEEVVVEHGEILSFKDFINNIQYYLSDFKRNPDIAKRIFETMLVYKALFIKDIRIALSVIKASGNAKYIIQHTEPDWLHFKDFWNNGLSIIWNSAHENPEIPHFFVLEDINLSSPECYARPLLDVIASIRSKIPFDGTSFPNNLFIFATKASSQNPTIGLKLYKETFPDWGSIAFNYDLNRISSKVFSLINGKIDTSVFSFDNMESDIDEIKISVIAEYELLFDEE